MATLSTENKETSSGSLAMNGAPAAAASFTSAVTTALPAVPPRRMTLEEQEAAVFGSAGGELADAMAAFVQRGIEAGVASLPLLQDPDKSKALVDRIQKPYLKHIDVMEAYAQRNIFTLRHVAPRRRQQIVERFQDPTCDDREDDIEDGTERDNDSQNKQPLAASTGTATLESASSSSSAPTINYPNKEEIPSKEQLANLQEELAQLALQIQTAQDRRRTLLHTSASLAATRSLTAGAVQSIHAAHLQSSSSSSDAIIQGPVTVAVMGGQGLQTLTREGKRLQLELGKRKQTTTTNNNNHNSNDYDNDDMDGDGLAHHGWLPPMVPKKQQRVLTLEEAYRQERQTVETTVENLSSLSNLLKPPNNTKRMEPTN